MRRIVAVIVFLVLLSLAGYGQAKEFPIVGQWKGVGPKGSVVMEFKEDSMYADGHFVSNVDRFETKDGKVFVFYTDRPGSTDSFKIIDSNTIEMRIGPLKVPFKRQ